MNKLGARRLLKLADILDKADALHRKRKELGFSNFETVHSCGTPACSLGHYAAYSRRWEIVKASDGDYFIQLKGSSQYAWLEDAEAEFNLERGDGNELFGFTGCGGAQTAKQAAKYIRAFVKRKQAEAT